MRQLQQKRDRETEEKKNSKHEGNQRLNLREKINVVGLENPALNNKDKS